MATMKDTQAVSGRQRLQNALRMGRQGLALQLRYLLMACQSNRPRPIPAEPNAPQHINDARLQALVHIAPHLSVTQRSTLYGLINEVTDGSARLSLLARAIRSVPIDEALPHARVIWESLEALTHPAQRASALIDIADFIHDTAGSTLATGALLRLIHTAQNMKTTEAQLRGLIGLAPSLPEAQSRDIVHGILAELERTRNDTLTTRSINTVAPALTPQHVPAAIALCRTIKSAADRARALTALLPFVPSEWRGDLQGEVLMAVEQISSEDERADALIALAPHMESATVKEYPRVLSHALSIAIGMQRRPLRARMLVSLAPHLTPDLQVEAIADVNSLPSERERANLLTQLAPTLPESMIVASLSVAYAMREQENRVQALAALARYSSPTMRHQTLLDALASANNIASHYERVRVLVSLLEMMPPAMREQTVTNALESARLIENESARARGISLLAPHLNDILLERALNAARELSNVEHRLNALIGLAGHLSDQHYGAVMSEMLGCINSITIDYKRARALTAIAPYVHAEDISTLESLANQLDDPIDRLNVLLALVPHVPAGLRTSIVQTAYRLLMESEPGYDRAAAIVALMPYLSQEQRDALIRAIPATLEAIEDEYDQASAIVLLAPLLVNEGQGSGKSVSRWDALSLALESALLVPHPAQRLQLLEQACAAWARQKSPERAFVVWSQLTTHLAELPLAQVVACLGALLPLLVDFAGEDAAREVANLLGVK
jgi:hypothetical protein